MSDTAKTVETTGTGQTNQPPLPESEKKWLKWSKSWLFKFIHRYIYRHRAEISIVFLEDGIIVLRPWINKSADQAELGAYENLYHYIYNFDKHSQIIGQYYRAVAQVEQMKAEKANSEIEAAFMGVKPTKESIN